MGGSKFIACHDQPARIATCVGDSQRFEIRDEVKIVNALPAELFQQVEHRVRAEFRKLTVKLAQVIFRCRDFHRMLEASQGFPYVKLGRSLRPALAGMKLRMD